MAALSSLPILLMSTVPALPGIITPGWRSLAVWAASVTVVLGLLVLEIGRDGGVGARIGLVFLIIIGGGAIAGVLTRAVTLFLQARGRPWWVIVPVSLLGVVLWPTVLAGLGVR